MFTARRRKLFTGLILFPLAVLLAGCDITVKTTVYDDDTLEANVQFHADKAQLKQDLIDSGMDAEIVDTMGLDALDCAKLTAEASTDPDLTVTDKSDSNTIHCEIQSKRESIDSYTSEHGGSLTHADGKYTLTIDPGTDELDKSLKELDSYGFDTSRLINLTSVFEFPGPVHETSVGEVDGNTVTITKLTDFAQRITIVAADKPEKGIFGSNSSDGKADPAKAGSSSILSYVLGFLALVVLIGVIVAIILVVVKKKGNGGPQGYPQQPQQFHPGPPGGQPTPGGYPTQPGQYGQPHGQQPHGYPQAPGYPQQAFNPGQAGQPGQPGGGFPQGGNPGGGSQPPAPQTKE